MGCEVEIEVENGKIISTKGNTCKRGAAFAEAEHFHPTRVLTTSVKTDIGRWLSVRSSAPIPREKIFSCIEILSKITVPTPVVMGRVVYANILDTGVDILATREIKE